MRSVTRSLQRRLKLPVNEPKSAESLPAGLDELFPPSRMLSSYPSESGDSMSNTWFNQQGLLSLKAMCSAFHYP